MLEFARRQAEIKRQTSGILAEISPSPKELIQAVLSDSNVTAAIQSGSVVVDMGMGDGRWLLSVLDHYSEVPCLCVMGVELDSERIELTRQALAAHSKSSRVEIIRADFMHVHVGLSNLVLAYLSRQGNRILAAKLERELSPGTIVIAVGFQFVWSGAKGRLLQTYKCPSTGLPAYIYIIDGTSLRQSSYNTATIKIESGAACAF